MRIGWVRGALGPGVARVMKVEGLILEGEGEIAVRKLRVDPNEVEIAEDRRGCRANELLNEYDAICNEAASVQLPGQGSTHKSPFHFLLLFSFGEGSRPGALHKERGQRSPQRCANSGTIGQGTVTGLKRGVETNGPL